MSVGAIATPRFGRGALEELCSRLPSAGDDRREGCRADFPFDLILRPRDPDTDPLASIRVFGRDLSEAGVGIEHAHALPFRKVLLEADDARLRAVGLGRLRLEAVLRWCRSLGEGRYESGGRLLRVWLD